MLSRLSLYFAVPLKQSHAYLTRATLSSIFRVCFENKGVTSVSYTLESMILSKFEPSLRQCSEVAHSCLPVSLVAGSMAFTALLAAAMLEAGTCIDSEPSGSGSADSTCCIVPSFKIDFAPALAMRSIGHVPITKNSRRIFSRIVASPRNS